MSKIYDFIVVGSGPGGMISAFLLSEKGYKVCLVEKGKKTDNSDFENFNSFKNYYDKVLPVISQDIFGFGQANCLGGGSVINGALIWGLPNHTQKLWKDEFGENFVNKINENYLKICHYLNVKNSQILNVSESTNVDSKLIKDASEKLKWNIVSVPRALEKCDELNNCGFGCNNKNSVEKIFLNKFIKNKGDVLTESEVKNFSLEKSSVKYLQLKNGKKIFGKKYILSAGSINSNLILQKSKITKKSFIQFHLNLKIVAFHKQKIYSEKGTMFTFQVQEFMDEGFVFMPTNFTKDSFLSSLLHLKTSERKKCFELYDNGGIYVTQVQPKAVGKIYQFNGNYFVKYFLSKDDKQLIKNSIKKLVKLLFEAGFESIVLPTKKINRIIKKNEWNPKLVDNIDSWEMLSVHSMAANRMGNDKRNSVVNIQGKIHGIDNLYITDSSCLPSSVGESPQGVIMSNALRIINENF